jgi:VIT1/CCC1 family predicted Fe2+/Mn2+ transporter
LENEDDTSNSYEPNGNASEWARGLVARGGARVGRRHRIDRKPHDWCRGSLRFKAGILVAGVAGLVAGAMSMAVGEYVSVSSQRDAEQADIGREKRELATDPQAELQELALIYEKRGLEKELAMKVAEQLSVRDRLGAHLRDELGINQASLSRPMQAAWISAASFAFFATIPIAALLVAPASLRIPLIAVLCLVSLAALGAFGGYLGGAPVGRASLRVTLGGALAMAVTALIGRILGVSIG